MSHLAFVKEADAAVEARLLLLLSRDAEWLYMERYKRGLQWLGRWYEPESELHKALESHQLFWAWWVNDWQHRDNDMSHRLTVDKEGKATYKANTAGALLYFYGSATLEDFYLSLHEPQKTKVTVPSIIMEEVKRELRKKRNENTFSNPKPQTK